MQRLDRTIDYKRNAIGLDVQMKTVNLSPVRQPSPRSEQAAFKPAKRVLRSDMSLDSEKRTLGVQPSSDQPAIEDLVATHFRRTWAFKARFNVPLESLLATQLRKMKNTLPVVLIRNQVYLIGSAKCIISKKGDVLFCKNTSQAS